MMDRFLFVLFVAKIQNPATVRILTVLVMLQTTFNPWLCLRKCQVLHKIQTHTQMTQLGASEENLTCVTAFASTMPNTALRSHSMWIM